MQEYGIGEFFRVSQMYDISHVMESLRMWRDTVFSFAMETS